MIASHELPGQEPQDWTSRSEQRAKKLIVGIKTSIRELAGANGGHSSTMDVGEATCIFVSDPDNTTGIGRGERIIFAHEKENPPISIVLVPIDNGQGKPRIQREVFSFGQSRLPVVINSLRPRELISVAGFLKKPAENSDSIMALATPTQKDRTAAQDASRKSMISA